MMLRIKKTISLLLAFFCLTGLLAGCKIELPNQVTSRTQTSQAENVATSVSQSESEVSSATSPPAASISAASSKAVLSASSASSASGNAGTDNAAKSSGVAATTKPQSSAPLQNEQTTCTLYIDCKTLLSHLNELDAGTKSIVPKNGVIYTKHTATFKSGETIFDVLNREMKANRIPFNFQSTTAYNSVYVTEIGGIGQTLSQSGWMYSVNGKFINIGCSLVKLKSGDKIEWHYTCENGRDLG